MNLYCNFYGYIIFAKDKLSCFFEWKLCDLVIAIYNENKDKQAIVAIIACKKYQTLRTCVLLKRVSKVYFSLTCLQDMCICKGRATCEKKTKTEA
jgi:hypothetical protein